MYGLTEKDRNAVGKLVRQDKGPHSHDYTRFPHLTGGGGGIIMAVVKEAPLRPDLLGATDLERSGRDFYTLRLYGAGIAEWWAGKQYSVGEQCTLKDVTYTALLPSNGVKPPKEGFWKAEQGIVIYDTINSPGQDIRFTNVFFLKNSIVPLIKWPELSAKEIEKKITTAYRIFISMPYAGPPNRQSTTYDEEDGRTISCF